VPINQFSELEVVKLQDEDGIACHPVGPLWKTVNVVHFPFITSSQLGI
jgi:hypothetical protein